ncbi:hypothetical protein C1I97_08675 [Streptomyces sp. NTH33]|uniref:hypothetical protein n=1 Tax=Streptomyces sp. NTH33 TaxID=1735453 RepID=UPI000DA7B589|nr:hypothetical protein [Streptomyces sp. NTH33]PZH15253.1 hypothetical protein C1I97_08675 [Streptomyces sp. NTH33]
MTDNKHTSDLDRVSQQNSFTDFARGVEERPGGGGLFGDLFFNPMRSVVEATPYGKAMHGRTSFETYDLNRMLDLVEQTNPEDLESSGKALWDARDAIKVAATELSGHIENVHWVGESGEAFRTWGRSLVISTHALSDFAGGAGDQITAAAMGLASVRRAMPPRDQRTDRKAPKDFSMAEQVGSNDAYTAAVQVEKHRQEAINQMNRLSSYYSVSTEQLKDWQSKAPEFKDMPDVGVPPPAPVASHPSGRSAPSVTTATGPHAVPGHHAPGAPVDHAVGHSPVDTTAPMPHVPGSASHPDVSVGTNTGTDIDSVGTLPPASTTPATGHTSPVTGTPGGGPINTFGPSYGTPVPNGMPGKGVSGAGSARTPASARGQGPMNQMGRAASTGQSTAKGPTSGGKPPRMGGGVMGGTPQAGGPAAPRAGAGPTTGAGRANGVVGGRPTSAAGTPAKGGARIPRGTVVGAEGAASSRTVASRPGQRGVFGVPEPARRPTAGMSGSRGGTAAEAVTGRPTARNSAVRTERNGMTRGGAGLVRGPGDQGKPEGRRSTERSQRPDYLVEDEETHLPTTPRRDVPPVVN